MARITVIGGGRIGGGLVRKWTAAGHQVAIGARAPEAAAVQELGRATGAAIAPISDALARAEVVAFAIPGAAMAETVSAVGSALDGKVVLDTANNVRGAVMNSAEAIARAAPHAAYVRAFNTLGFEFLEDPEVSGTQADMFFCSPDGEPRELAERLIRDVGLRPIWVGGPEEVDVVDGVLRLWFTLVMKRGHSRRLAFKMLED